HEIDFSPDGRTVVTTNNKSWVIRLWDATTGKPMPSHVLQGFNNVHFRPDGKSFLAWHNGRSRDNNPETGKKAEYLTTADGRPIGETLHVQDKSTGVHFKGKRILTVAEAGTVRLWDAATGKPVGRPIYHRGT